MSKYNVTLDVTMMEFYGEIEADSEEEAVEIAKSQSQYESGSLTVFEVKEL